MSFLREQIVAVVEFVLLNDVYCFHDFIKCFTCDAVKYFR